MSKNIVNRPERNNTVFPRRFCMICGRPKVGGSAGLCPSCLAGPRR